jgi:hypothetical protein
MQKEKTTKEIFDEQMGKIPEDVRSAILSVDYVEKLQAIYKRQRLLIDQADKLEMETYLVMLGLEPVSNYVANLKKNLGIPLTKAQEIAVDINENIFKPIRESLQKMNQELEEGGEETMGTGVDEETETTKFTNSNEASLNRDQILNEIENPAIIDGGDRTMNFSAEVPVKTETTELEIRPVQILEVVPGQTVHDIKKAPIIIPNIMEAKMTSTTITSKEIINAKPENKLPEVTKRPYSAGNDPYKEPLN